MWAVYVYVFFFFLRISVFCTVLYHINPDENNSLAFILQSCFHFEHIVYLILDVIAIKAEMTH